MGIKKSFERGFLVARPLRIRPKFYKEFSGIGLCRKERMQGIQTGEQVNRKQEKEKEDTGEPPVPRLAGEAGKKSRRAEEQ